MGFIHALGPWPGCFCSSWLRNLGLAGSQACQPVQGSVVTYHQLPSTSFCALPPCHQPWVCHPGQGAPHPQTGVPHTTLTWAIRCCASTHVFTAVHPHKCSQKNKTPACKGNDEDAKSLYKGYIHSVMKNWACKGNMCWKHKSKRHCKHTLHLFSSHEQG